ncbi:MAG: protein kinase [Dehalococcoidia bacterium]|nr:protein kinase [Dehalococcoidia bacterium]
METLGGRYRLSEPLGEGGMATVFKAQDLLLERMVAVKVLREQWAADAEFISRFRQEARAAASLSHPNIVAIYDVGEDAGRHYIVMEYVEGPSLKEEIASGPLSPLRAVEIAVQVCAGLQYAHQKGIIHRDIKPHNILLQRGQAKIADFGIARALGSATQTGAGDVFGSPQYLSPEQVKGEEATAASDIYSLGISLYEASTSAPPFQADSPIATALKHLNETPVPPRQVNGRIPPSIEAIILKALAKDPRERFLSAAQMGKALSDCLARSQEDTGKLRLAAPVAPIPVPVSFPPASQHPSARLRSAGRRTFPWGPMIGAMALVGMVVWLTILSPALIRKFVPGPTSSTPTPVPPIVTPTPAVPTRSPTPVPQVLVPGVTNMLPQDARIVIESQGLTYREGSKEYSNDVPDGRVIRQTPSSGAGVQPGGIVTVTISQGPNTVQVPTLTNLAVAQAEARLNDAGLKLDRKDVWSSTAPEGVVSQQTPPPGTKVARGSVVTLTVSQGVEKVPVPDVVGLSEDKAQKALQQAGFKNYPLLTSILMAGPWPFALTPSSRWSK